MTSDAHADVLLVTATDVETAAVLTSFASSGQPATPDHIDGRVYFDLGTVTGARVRLTQCEMGTSGLGASQQTVEKGIVALSPAAVIMVGIAFGMNERKQSIGDVLVTEHLRLYDLQRVGTQDGEVKIVLRGDKAHAATLLVNLLKSARFSWKGATLRFGPVLTGEKLVDNLDFRAQLHAFEPEAIGGEMEGTGLYVACHERKVDWILVKAICDWGDGYKGDDKAERQALAAKNAAAFVLHVLRFVKVDWNAYRGPARLIVTPARVDLWGKSGDIVLGSMCLLGAVFLGWAGIPAPLTQFSLARGAELVGAVVLVFFAVGAFLNALDKKSPSQTD